MNNLIIITLLLSLSACGAKVPQFQLTSDGEIVKTPKAVAPVKSSCIQYEVGSQVEWDDGITRSTDVYSCSDGCLVYRYQDQSFKECPNDGGDSNTNVDEGI